MKEAEYARKYRVSAGAIRKLGAKRLDACTELGRRILIVSARRSPPWKRVREVAKRLRQQDAARRKGVGAMERAIAKRLEQHFRQPPWRMPDEIVSAAEAAKKRKRPDSCEWEPRTARIERMLELARVA